MPPSGERVLWKAQELLVGTDQSEIAATRPAARSAGGGQWLRIYAASHGRRIWYEGQMFHHVIGDVVRVGVVAAFLAKVEK